MRHQRTRRRSQRSQRGSRNSPCLLSDNNRLLRVERNSTVAAVAASATPGLFYDPNGTLADEAYAELESEDDEETSFLLWQ